MDRIRIALIGAGKIAVDQHMPAIAANPGYELVGVVDPARRNAPVPTYGDLDALLASSAVDAVAVCTPPQARFRLALAALDAGCHVLLEKPPCATVQQLDELQRRAAARSLTLYTAWHSQHAPAVPAVRRWLEGRRPIRIGMTWCEDVRRWHPGQRWLWEAGGLGIFDPAINAFSILTAALEAPIHLEGAVFEVPANSDTPIAAQLSGAVGGGAAFSARLDFLQTGLQTWSIDIEADDGRLGLAMGGAELTVDGAPQALPATREYPSIYARFGDLVRAGRSEVDARPLAIAADAFLIARRVSVAPFFD